MTTVLQLYARFTTLAVFVVIAFSFMIGVALAQDAAPAATETPPDMIGLVFSSLSAGAAALVVAILGIVTRHAPAWVVAIIDWFTTTDAVKWEDLLDRGLDRAEAFARSKFDPAKQRNDYINAMVGFIHTFNPEIVKWLDKNQNGVIDLIEARFPIVKRPAPVVAARSKVEAIQ